MPSEACLPVLWAIRSIPQIGNWDKQSRPHGKCNATLVFPLAAEKLDHEREQSGLRKSGESVNG